MRDQRFVVAAVAFSSLFAGALVTSLIATDLGRMFLILMPIVAVASAEVFQTLLARRKYVWSFVLVCFATIEALAGLPNIFCREGYLGQWKGWLSSLHLAVLLGSSVTVLLLRKELALSLRSNFDFVTGAGREVHVRSLRGRTGAGL